MALLLRGVRVLVLFVLLVLFLLRGLLYQVIEVSQTKERCTHITSYTFLMLDKNITVVTHFCETTIILWST